MDEHARALLVDFGGTLATESRPRAALYAEVGACFGARLDAAETARRMAAAHDALPSVIDGQPRYSGRWFEAVISEVFAAEPVTDPAGLRGGLFDAFEDPENFHVFADGQRLLARAREAGLAIAVVSIWSERLDPLLRALGLRDQVDLVVSSATLGVEKPDPGHFRAALEGLGVEASRAVHVGDDPVNDLEGAAALGIEAWLLDRSGKMGAHPRRVRSLDEVPLPPE